MKKYLKIIYFAVLILWLAFIFSNSATNAVESTEQSDGLIAALTSLLSKAGVTIDFNSHVIRKLAHFAEFFILGLLAGVFAPLFGKEPKACFLPSLFFGMTVCLCDETIQLFHAGRSGQISDVWLDFSAFLAGTLFIFTGLLIFKRANKK